jgi:hypothetical protein
VEASCKIFDSLSNLLDEYFLLSGVMACRVLEGDTMLHNNPPYIFQALYSSRHHKVFRIAPSFGDAKDSHGSSIAPFRHLDFQINRQKMQELDVQDADRVVNEGKIINGKILLRDPQVERTYIIEFPVKHINTQNGRPGYQVETGPVALPFTGADPAASAAMMQTAFLAFNHNNRVEYIPFTIRGNNTERQFIDPVRMNTWQQLYVSQ